MIFQFTSSQRTEIAALQSAVAAEAWTEIEVDVTANQLKTSSNTGIDLFAVPGAGKYYEAYIKIEYTHVTTAYDVTGMGFLGVLINGDYKNIGLSMLQLSANSVAMVSSYTASGANDTEDATFMYTGSSNQKIQIKAWNNVNPTLGNGTIKAKIKYRVITTG